MGEIITTTAGPLVEKGAVMNLDANLLPSFRVTLARQRNVQKNFLLNMWGGLGDVVCAEPTVRFAVNNFKGTDISVFSRYPELFSHLKLKHNFDSRMDAVPREKYLSFDSGNHSGDFADQFLAYHVCNTVDYVSIKMFRRTLPVAERPIILRPSNEDFLKVDAFRAPLVIHAGQSWNSRTLPIDWWNRIIALLVDNSYKPVLIGSEQVVDRGFLPVDSTGCVDLRNKLTIMETTALLQKAQVVLTNDSAPLHLAASGSAWIGFFATARHPDCLKHWRRGEFGWRMEDLALGGMYQELDNLPINDEELRLDKADVTPWVPPAGSVAEWAMEKM